MPTKPDPTISTFYRVKEIALTWLERGGRIFVGLTLAIIKPALKWVIRSFVFSAVILGVAFLLLPRAKPLEMGTTLYVSIDRPLAESSPFDRMPYLQFLLHPPKLSANAIVDAILDAADDPNIEKIVLSLDGMEGTGQGPAQRIGYALDTVRANGKKVIVFASNFDNARYLLALHADEILMHPMGRFDVGGLKAGAVYYGEALSNLGVQVIVGQAGAYKSAVEPFTRSSMSTQAADALGAVMRSQRGAIIGSIAHRRELSPTTIITAFEKWDVNRDGRSHAERAIDFKLVDRLTDAPEFMDEAFGAPRDDSSAPYIALSRYMISKRPDRCELSWKERDRKGRLTKERIGVITVEGEIRRGYTTADAAGATSVVSQIEGFARADENTGLLVRIDSPGGDAQAAEFIRSSLERYSSLGRPVVISMGSTAASGGYWIASAGDQIYAEQTTITGSIGVFAIRASAAGALEQYGVAWDGLTLGRTNPYGGITEPTSDLEQMALSSDVTRVYDRFKQIVSNARGLEIESASEWAEGRILHASDALSLNLIDEIGSVDSAISALSALTGTPESCTTTAPPVTSAQSVLGAFAPSSVVSQAIEEIAFAAFDGYAEALPVEVKELARVSKLRGVQALCALCDM